MNVKKINKKLQLSRRFLFSVFYAAMDICSQAWPDPCKGQATPD